MRSLLFCMRTPGAKDPRHPYRNFYPSAAAVRMCGTDPIVRVELTEAPVGTPDEECYWAWWHNDRQTFTMVYSWKGGVEICFPGGTPQEIRRGTGLLCRVLVKEMP